jgi:hypothetical protein
MTVHRRHLLMLLLCCVALSSAGGCAGVPRFESPPALPVPGNSEPEVVLVYRTSSTRLNELWNSSPNAHPLPPFTACTLTLRGPQPGFASDQAVATLRIATEGESPDEVAQTSQLIPLWQLQAALDKLERDGFYKRARVLGAVSYVATNQAGRHFAKDYREITELDTLILHMHRSANTAVTRLPPVH